MAQAKRTPATLPVKRVARVSLPDEIYGQIKYLILEGGIAPGQRVTIQGLAADFGVSAMPVREALQRLTTERALTVISGRSVGIPDLSAERLEDLRRVRIGVESLAAQWAADRGPEGILSALQDQVAAMDRAIAKGDPHGYVRGNRAFHFLVYRAAGSETLLSIIEGLWLQVSPYFHLLHESGNYALANKQHKRLLKALEKRDCAAAGAAIRADIEGAAKVLRQLLD